MRAAGCPTRSRRAAPTSRPWRSATTLCWWIVSRFSWRAETKLAPSSSGKRRDDARDHLAHAVLDEARAAMGLFDDLDLVGALHQLVDLRGHARLGDLQQRGGVDLGRALLDAADLQGGEAALVVGGHGHALEDALDLLRREPVARRAARARERRRAPARTGTRSCPSPRRRPCGACRARRRPRARAACRSPACGRPRRAPACARGSAPRSSPRRARAPWRARTSSAMCCASVSARNGDSLRHDLADRLVDDLLEARHVRALLLAAQIDEALQAREEQLVADAHDLLDARHADAREPDRDRRRARLHVVVRALRGDSGGVSRVACTVASLARDRVRPPRASAADCRDRRFWYHSALGSPSEARSGWARDSQAERLATELQCHNATHRRLSVGRGGRGGRSDGVGWTWGSQVEREA